MFTILKLSLPVRFLPTQKFCDFKLFFPFENVIFGCCPVCPIHMTRNHRILELEDILDIVILQMKNPEAQRGWMTNTRL